MLKYYKTRDVKSPSRGTPGSAGIDFFVPNDYRGANYLHGGESINVPSGIHVKIPHGYALIALNKSGVAIKKELHVGAQVIDEDYQGELHLNLTNVGNDHTKIIPGDKIVQFVLIPVKYAKLQEEANLTDLYTEVTERGEGMAGSTGIR